METRAQAAVLLGPFGRATITRGRRAVVAHAHAEFNFLFKIAGADASFRLESGALPLSDERMIVLNPWQSHGKEESTGGDTLILSLLIAPDWLRAQTRGVGAESADILFPSNSVAMTPAVRAHAQRLVASVTSFADAGAEALHAELLLQLVGTVREAYAAAASPWAGGRIMDARIRRAAEVIQRNAADNPNLLTIASQVGLSRSHFFAQFKHSLGVTPQHYLDWVRMRLAIGMLSKSDLPMAEVAARLGFFAPSHFTRFFTQHVAIPPGAFRRSIVS
jgi:AraC-like DNA-binding protein